MSASLSRLFLSGLAPMILAGAVLAAPDRTPETAFVDTLPVYAPLAPVSGVIRIWGHGSHKRNFMGNLMERWIARFRALQPGVAFENRLYGTASAIGALSTGAGDLALLGEEISPACATEFLRAKGYAPTEFQVATGSLDVNFFDYAHMIFVHRDNPLASLSLPQLEAIFGTEGRLGAKRARTWGDLGLTDEWAGKPIQPYGWKVDEDFALFFRERVLGDSHRWNPTIKEFVHVLRPDGTQYDHGQQILDALGADRYGIAISNTRYAIPAVKTVALSWRDGEPAVQADLATLIAQQFPLVRIIPAFIDQPPGQPVPPVLREFLRFVLSREGQQALIEETGYLPLSPKVIAAQLQRLETGQGTAAAPVAPVNATFTPRSLPPERRHPAATRTLVIRGNAEMREIIRRWTAAYALLQPEIRIEAQLDGSDVAMAALTSARADLAFLGRDAAAQEAKGFEWIYRYPPARFEVMTGAAVTPGQSPALVFHVHPDNPLAQLTLAQADALFGTERRRGAAAPLRTWGNLGLTGEWADKPVHLYAPDTESGTGRFFRAAVLGDSRSLAWDRLTEFTDTSPLAAPSHDASAKVLAALAADRYGLAVAAGTAANVKPLALQSDTSAPAVKATAETIGSRRYPLARPAYVYCNRAPEEAFDPVIAGFLQYILSPAGQREITAAGAYLPLPADLAAAQAARLK